MRPPRSNPGGEQVVPHGAGVRASHPAERDAAPPFPRPGLRRARWLLIPVVGLVAVGAVAALASRGKVLRKPDESLVWYTVQRGNLAIAVTERGNLDSQQNTQIFCEVDDISGDGIIGTPIVWIVSNGASVKKGDLLVELDAAPHKERLDRQFLSTERARAAQIQAQAKYENQLTQNETLKANAELDVKLAELELEMFSDQEKGTHKLAVEEIERLIEDINNEIRAAEANLKLRENEKQGIESLFKLGYAGKSELERSRLDFLQAEGQYAAKMNKLQTQLAGLEKLQTYEQQMKALALQGKLETARRQEVQVLRNSEALLAQAKAVLDATNEELKKEEELLVRYREQVDKCKIYAPDEGMVAYALSDNRYYRDEIRVGAPARPRQHLLSLPNLRRMQVKTAVHESVLDQIKPGLAATIRSDAFPDRVYHGSIQSVAVLPDPGGYLSSDTKVYETIVIINDDVAQIKPGMTAVVEIHVDELPDVLSVPVQAVVQADGRTWCYVDQLGTPQRRDVKLGRTNDKFVQILEGLEADDRVVLNPMAIIEDSSDRSPRKSDAPRPEKGTGAGSPEKTQAPAARPAA